MSDNIIIDTSVNIITYTSTKIEPIISGAQGPQGPRGIAAADTLAALTDVSLDVLNDGSLLVYDSFNQVWKSTTVLEKQALECGQY